MGNYEAWEEDRYYTLRAMRDKLVVMESLVRVLREGSAEEDRMWEQIHRLRKELEWLENRTADDAKADYLGDYTD